MEPWKAEVTPDAMNRSRRDVCVVGPNDATVFVQVGNGTVAERLRLARRIARLLNAQDAEGVERWAKAIKRSREQIAAEAEVRQ